MGRLVPCLALVAGLGAAGTPAIAAECAGVDQHSLNRCAEDEYRVADRGLNAQYKATRKVLADFDAAAEKQLVLAQRAWIGFRDAHCETAAFANKGGSAEPLTRFGCLAELTTARTTQLQELADGF